jgi:chorismate--pyruvate lyase
VLLHSGGKPLVLARTVIPAHTLRGVHHNLSRLGSRPLGEVIFADPRLQRLEMHVANVKPGDWSRQLVEQVPINEPLWGRRTVYEIRRRQLLVSEFFLPELVERR